MSSIAPRSQAHQVFAWHNKFGTFPVFKDMNNTKNSAADAAAVATKIAANQVDGQRHEEDDLPPLPWKKVTLAATLPDGAENASPWPRLPRMTKIKPLGGDPEARVLLE